MIPEQDLEQITRSQPLGRFGSVRDIADATVYLFSDAGSYVSGQTLVGKLTWDHFYHPPERFRILMPLAVDGAAWRIASSTIGSGMKYPDFLLSGTEVSGVTGKKKSKL